MCTYLCLYCDFQHLKCIDARSALNMILKVVQSIFSSVKIPKYFFSECKFLNSWILYDSKFISTYKMSQCLISSVIVGVIQCIFSKFVCVNSRHFVISALTPLLDSFCAFILHSILLFYLILNTCFIAGHSWIFYDFKFISTYKMSPCLISSVIVGVIQCFISMFVCVHSRHFYSLAVMNFVWF